MPFVAPEGKPWKTGSAFLDTLMEMVAPQTAEGAVGGLGPSPVGVIRIADPGIRALYRTLTQRTPKLIRRAEALPEAVSVIKEKPTLGSTAAGEFSPEEALIRLDPKYADPRNPYSPTALAHELQHFATTKPSWAAAQLNPKETLRLAETLAQRMRDPWWKASLESHLKPARYPARYAVQDDTSSYQALMEALAYPVNELLFPSGNVISRGSAINIPLERYLESLGYGIR